MIKIDNVSFAYGNALTLQNVSFHESEPMIIGLWGRSGSGKTTLMKLLSGMEQPNQGTISVNGVSHITIQKQ
ncbi:ATP-binding cassette domain-containing protein [Geomicrobium sp. JCM 19055]|uniref:ATP-binding cassette domain-containing protein n=1 Tax=Geomicrobium sp. JCM 19055 TaxID=1460649 RepID=UPI00045EDD83|nr:ATP-binding cassette domain-containing protein [Geomicrobium sp. JCM 19055]GAK00208.1 ABC transporter ATP-binding protein [Geomicrobium sp. JCM 19055]